MIYLVHGQNVVESRRFLVRLKTNYQNIEALSGKTITNKALEKILKEFSFHLFGGKSALLIEHFSGDWTQIPKNISRDLDLILWSDKKIDTRGLTGKAYLFSKPLKATTFNLSDAILYKNEKEAQNLTSELLSSKEPVEKIIGALTHSLFLVYCAKKESLSGANLPEFVKDKLIGQAKLWNKLSLRRAMIYLLSTDVSIKEGMRADLAMASFISRVVAS
ncbi:MAG: hypothetical protein WD187_04080 [Candidatus Woykebacteria bacterium]